jgi:hypothetical protein
MISVETALIIGMVGGYLICLITHCRGREVKGGVVGIAGLAMLSALFAIADRVPLPLNLVIAALWFIPTGAVMMAVGHLVRADED